MPTGYTADVTDGITFEQFVWNCARAFGALVTMRDDPADARIPERFEPSAYYADAAAKALAKLTELRSLTREQAHAASVADFQQRTQAWEKRREDRAVAREQYEAMLAQVNAWTPPTPDHEPMKKFMAQQLTESIAWDCSGKYDDEPEARSTDGWLAVEIARAEKDLAYAETAQAEEIERTEQRNAWLAALRESVPQPGTV